MTRLIINADDLGLTPGVNRAILHAATNGVVTSATLMANGAAFADAVACARSLPPSLRFSVGCHLVLVDGVPVSAPATVPSLAPHDRFRQGAGELGLAARLGRLSPSEIQAEATAQFRAIQNSGVQLSHFDAHKHAHMFPQVLAPALRAAAESGIPAVRNPFESSHPLPLSVLFARPKLLKRYAQVMLLRSMRSKWLRLVRKSGLKAPDGSLGVIVTGELDERLLRATFENIPQGTWELVCHPGYDDADLANVRTRLRTSRAKELQLLTAPESRKLLDQLGIELISYREL